MITLKLKRAILPFLLVLLIIAGCKKEEGIGGTSTIKGKVIVYKYDPPFDGIESIYPATDERVYIIYGEDGTAYDDDYNTSYDGSYEFKYLQKGKYRLFAYSSDSTGAHTSGNLSGRKTPVFVNVEIKSNGSTVEVPDLIILNNKP